MDTNKTSEKAKKHADFQDNYRRSSNFNNPIKKDEFKIKKDGDLKMQKKKKGKELDESEKERISNAMDSLEKDRDDSESKQ